ncbi:predicted GPI-anchored protein 58 [Panicum hallii]|uniref:predicted GPI-anchored protein 58 n=1 Tax=Panicum hallii TaxID=206008 RepID=UPI000DF4D04D|nr:predicted GPI-anchored protein 58 [Panicum hallii]
MPLRGAAPATCSAPAAVSCRTCSPAPAPAAARAAPTRAAPARPALAPHQPSASAPLRSPPAPAPLALCARELLGSATVSRAEPPFLLRPPLALGPPVPERLACRAAPPWALSAGTLRRIRVPQPPPRPAACGACSPACRLRPCATLPHRAPLLGSHACAASRAAAWSRARHLLGANRRELPRALACRLRPSGPERQSTATSRSPAPAPAAARSAPTRAAPARPALAPHQPSASAPLHSPPAPAPLALCAREPLGSAAVSRAEPPFLLRPPLTLGPLVPERLACRAALGPVGRKYIEGERDRGKGAPPVEEEKKETPGRKELREKRLPQDLCELMVSLVIRIINNSPTLSHLLILE